MKRILLIALNTMLFAAADAQTTSRTPVQDSHDRYANIEVKYATTTTLPEGTSLKKGKLTLKKGYRANHLDSNRVVIVQKPNGEISGAFKCKCEADSSRFCSVSIIDGAIRCVATGGCDCTLDVVINPSKNIAITSSDNHWRKLILQPADSRQQNTEDTSQGEKVYKKKSKRVISPSSQ